MVKRKSLEPEDGDVVMEEAQTPSKKARRPPLQESINGEDNDEPVNGTPTKPRPRTPASATPRKPAPLPLRDSLAASPAPDSEAPQTPRGRGRPKGSKNKPRDPNATHTPRKAYTPKSKKPGLFGTPVKAVGLNTPSRNAADRSARRKTTKALIERTVNGESDEEDEDAEEEIERAIYGDEAVDGEVDEEGNPILDAIADGDAAGLPPETPTKRGRGRPKGSKNRIRSPTPLGDLPPHERYFAQQRLAAQKTSNNTLSSLSLLDHSEYFALLREYEDPHKDDMDFLRSIHERSFAQWGFELSQGFSVCLYGFGSQRQILSNFAQHVYDQQTERGIEKPKIVVVNGYTPNITTRDVLGAIGACLPDLPKKLGATSAEATERILSHLSSLPQTSDNRITLLINSLDSPGLRRAATQTLLARLASSPSIHLLCSVSHPNFPLLWDSALRTHYNFVFHDATTLAPYDMEIDVVESVHQLLGRSGRRVGGREGVGFVLRSLPVHARSLYRILCLEILVLMDEGGGDFGGFVEEDEEDEDGGVRGAGGGRPRSGEVGVEYRALYTKAVEDFVCGDEVAFRSLLKEFHDHQMITSRKDAMGTEILGIPFRREEVEAILEDLMS